MRRKQSSGVRRDGALVVCAKAPIPGQVKTGLSPHLTASQSAALYRRFLTDTIETTLDVEGVDFFVAYSPRGTRSAIGRLVPPAFSFLSPAGSGRGERTADVFSRLFNRGYGHILMLSCDNPDLPSCLLHQAVEVIQGGGVDMVLGPNEGGGFYLLGLTHEAPELFPAIDWEGGATADQALRQARKLGLRARRLPAWYQVETIDDLRRHFAYYSLRKGPDGPQRSHTGRYLQKIHHRFATA